MLNLAMKKYSKNLDLSFEQADATHLLFKASESTNWLPFINRGLESLLQEVNLRVSRRITYLGVIQIVVIDC